ncbi:uncharacterized protein [Elaeis guineensis]|uniref:Uncharacterized protein LOC105060248 n=1 Tax=Elaeis guineensis var. tenera TaxID=51953 RepID=A0A6I9SFL8_ELAGV|nr:uncharacterized protein LOC105060248 [Elaeis guineensis]
MGSGSSRLKPAPPGPRAESRGRLSLASFLCGGGGASSASSSAAAEMEIQQSDKSVMSSTLHEPVLANNLQVLVKESPLTSLANNSSSSTIEQMISGQNSNGDLMERSTEIGNGETSDPGKCLSVSKDLVPSLPTASSGPDVTHAECSCDLASTSRKPEHLEPLLRNVESTLAPAIDLDNHPSDCGSQTSPMRFSNSMPHPGPGHSPASRISPTENPSNVLDILSPSSTSSSSSTWNLSGEEPTVNITSAGAAFLTSDRSREQRNGTVLHVDVVSISSNALSSSTGEASSSDARRNSRRLFWDAFSRRSSRNIDSPSIFLSAEDIDDLGSRDRWLLDIGDDIFGNGVEDDSIYMRRRRYHPSGLSWHSRSEIRERIRAGFDDSNRQTSFCPTGLHPDGTCSCDSLLMTEESSTRASISRIVMLAEALFEVLDEIHRQPVSLSLSMVSLPAPESVVNSLPSKNYEKLDGAGSGDDVEQCYICLAEYEDGDKIRVLPCRHEYHMSCVDKWLKEIHGVCPLCRGDVCEGMAESSSNL